MEQLKKRIKELKNKENEEKQKPKTLAPNECPVAEPDKVHAVVLNKTTGEATPANVAPDAKKFSLNNCTYNIRENSKYQLIKPKLQLAPPFIGTIITLWSFYRAGHPEPIGWSESDGFTAEDISVIDELETTIQGMSDSMKGEKQKHNVGHLKWMVIILIVAVVGIAAMFILPGILKGAGIIG